MQGYNKRPDKGEQRRRRQQERAELAARAQTPIDQQRQRREEHEMALIRQVVNNYSYPLGLRHK